MGQPVAVIQKPSTTPGIVRFETNRTLTGMGHERFQSTIDAVGDTPAAELARRLFGSGRVAAVHVYANIVTVELARGFDASGIDAIVANLYQYWKPGMKPPSFEELTAAAEAESGGGAAPASSADAGGDPALSAAAQRVPAHLLERSRAARERWKANHS